MQRKLIRAAAALCVLLLLCAGVLTLATQPHAGGYGFALAAARQYLADASPSLHFSPDGSYAPLSGGLYRLGFVDPDGRPLSLTLWRDPVAGRFHVCGAVYAQP